LIWVFARSDDARGEFPTIDDADDEDDPDFGAFYLQRVWPAVIIAVVAAAV
jgi:hypothetical protein